MKGYVPTTLGDVDPPYILYSTTLIRQFLGLETGDARVIEPRHPKKLECLDEEDPFLSGSHFCVLCAIPQH